MPTQQQAEQISQTAGETSPGEAASLTGMAFACPACLPQGITPGEAFVDVTHLATKAGFLVPVAVSPGLWQDLCAVPEGSDQDVLARLSDLFFVARWVVAQEPILAIREVTFTLPLPLAGNEAVEGDEGYDDRYAVRLVTGGTATNGGAPMVTFFRDGEGENHGAPSESEEARRHG